MAASRPAVLVTRRVPASVRRRLDDVCDVEVWTGTDPMPRSELLSRVAGKQGLMCVITDRIDAEVLEAGQALRVVANIAVGYDNVDVGAARSRDVVVTNTPDVLTGAVAEFTWGLILAITRRIPEGDRLIRRSGWEGWRLDFMLGTELAGKQLGIVGAGRIGRAVAAGAPTFGMTAVFAARPGTAPTADRLSLDQLLHTSDVVSLHVPLTDDTHRLIDQRRLTRMKRSAYLVNTARGPVVDERALAWALREHLLAGAALDVYEAEPSVRRELLDLENVVLAPHLGSATRETRTEMAMLAARNLLAVLAGDAAITPVDA